MARLLITLNNPLKRDYTLVILLAAAGLISSLLTTSLSGTGLLGGVVFGAVMSVSFAATGISRDFWGAVRFTIVCTAAYFIALFAAVGGQLITQLVIPGERWSMGHAETASPIAFFVGGTVGAFLVLGEWFFLVQPERKWELSAIRGLRWSPVGGVLGAAGSLLSSPAGPPSGLFVIWQTGMGALLGLFSLSLTAPRLTAPQSSSRSVKRTFPIAYKLFFVLLAIWPTYFLIRRISADHSAQHRQEEISKAVSETPLKANLPAVQPVPTWQALVLRKIAGTVPVLPYERSFVATEPNTTVYSVGYQAAMPQVPLDFHPTVSVSVTQYPNSQWATYALKDVPIPNAGIDYAKYVQTVTTLGSPILVNTAWRSKTGTGDLYYYWSSGNNLVVIVFHYAENDEFIRAYLEKYPSSLKA